MSHPRQAELAVVRLLAGLVAVAISIVAQGVMAHWVKVVRVMVIMVTVVAGIMAVAAADPLAE